MPDTHRPVVMLAADPETCWVNVVASDQVTAVCPEVPWTWRVVPETCAISPEVPGSRCCPPPDGLPDAGTPAAEDAVVEAVEQPVGN